MCTFLHTLQGWREAFALCPPFGKGDQKQTSPVCMDAVECQNRAGEPRVRPAQSLWGKWFGGRVLLRSLGVLNGWAYHRHSLFTLLGCPAAPGPVSSPTSNQFLLSAPVSSHLTGCSAFSSWTSNIRVHQSSVLAPLALLHLQLTLGESLQFPSFQ